MMRHTGNLQTCGWRIGTAMSLLMLAAGCASAGGPQGRQPGGSLAAGVAVSQTRHTPADVDFMHGMLLHHAQALEMTSLVPDRAQAEQVKLIAQRIDLSQHDEIARMERWLDRRGEPRTAPMNHAADSAGAGHEMHPGMLSPAEISTLAAASGARFDRLFLEYMIRHHEGAITMVADLFATEGAGQESETYQFASEVDSDQRVEIARMQAILQTLQ